MSKDTWINDILAGQYDGQDVELKGWIHRSRGSNKIRFIVIRAVSYTHLTLPTIYSV